MNRVFSFFGGRRCVLTGFLAAYGAIMHKMFDAETAKQLTEYVAVAVGAFIGGESIADGMGRLKNGK